MFESTIQTTLAGSTALCALLSTYKSGPAIFANGAPEGAELPRVTYRIVSGPLDGSRVIRTFTVFVDVWDYGLSAVKVNQAAELIEFLFDGKSFEHDRLSDIRFELSGGGMVDDPDERVKHYNHQFSVRASRKKWTQQL